MVIPRGLKPLPNNATALTLGMQFLPLFPSRTVCIPAKGQLISKEIFAILEFFQKTNETIQS
jgi:hypothetical protein